MKEVLFVCTGNTCRSPIAEALFNALAAEKGIDARAGSAGLHVYAPGPASDLAILAAAGLGADLRSHVSRQVTNDLIEAADAVYTMTGSQADLLRTLMPAAADKIIPLAADDIADPFGGSFEVYRQISKEIDAAVRAIL